VALYLYLEGAAGLGLPHRTGHYRNPILKLHLSYWDHEAFVDMFQLTPDVNSGHEIFLYCHLLCIELPFIESRG